MPKRRPAMLNRIPDCFLEEAEAPVNVGVWVRREDPHVIEAELGIFARGDKFEHFKINDSEDVILNPIDAALRVLTGTDSLLRYNVHYVDQRFAAFQQDIEKRIEEVVNERVEAALTARAEGRTRANAVLGRLVAQLRDTTEEDEEVSEEEEARLWTTVDFSVFDEKEE